MLLLSSGQINLCDNREVIGLPTPQFRRVGAFAEYVTVPARIAYHLPDNMPFPHAALIEAVSAAEKSPTVCCVPEG